MPCSKLVGSGGGLDLRADRLAVPQTGNDHQDRHVAILEAGAAVFSDLALAARIDHAMLNDAEDVGVPWVTVRYTEVRSRFGARVDLGQPRGRNRHGAANPAVRRHRPRRAGTATR